MKLNETIQNAMGNGTDEVKLDAVRLEMKQDSETLGYDVTTRETRRGETRCCETRRNCTRRSET